MKSRILLFSAFALAGLIGWYACSPSGVATAYRPRLSELGQSSSFLEMEHYMKLLRGNLATGEYDPSDWSKMYDAVQKYNLSHAAEKSNSIAWWEMGPDNIGGRTRAILALNDNQTVFAGSVTGGLWKSTNAANSWDQVETFPSCPVCSIDQTLNGTIFVGTGSNFETGGGDGGSGAIGNGVYYSTDGGNTWAQVPGTETDPFDGGEAWIFTNDLCADPVDNDRIWIAGSAGIGYWEPGMAAPNMDMNGLPNQYGHDIACAVDGSYMLVGMGSARVYRSTDGGASFTQIEEGLPNSSDRVRLEISTDDTDVCYALYSDGFMDGVYYSSNAGDSFSTIWPSGNIEGINPFGDNGQGYYDLALAIIQGEPGRAIVGGVTLWQCGATEQPEQIAYGGGFGLGENYVHADIHTFEQAPDGTLYIGCDGGVFKSTDGAATFLAANRNYNVTQYYGIAHSGGFPVMGGSQDNGSTVILGMNNGFFPMVSDQQALEVQGGDGFDCDMTSVTEPNSTLVFASSQYSGIARYDAQGNGGQFWDNDILNLIDPNTNEIGPFYSVLRLYENTEDENSEQYVILVNPEDQDITDTTFTLFTQNLTLPFTYTLEDGDVLHYWEELERPAFSSTELFTQDPNYWWLPAQDIDFEEITCDSIVTDTTLVIDEITFLTDTIFWMDTLFYENDTIVVEDFTVVILDSDTTWMEEYEYEYINCVTTYHYAADVIEDVHEQRLIQDTFTSMFVTGFYGSEGIWLTRQALNPSTTPDWWKIGTAPSTGVKTFEFHRDGDVMWYSSWSGGLWRVRGLSELWSEDDVANLEITQVIANAGGVITSIATDPNDINHVVITIGGYGTTSGGKVRESTNANSASPTFTSIWEFTGADTYLERMPVYASIISSTDAAGNPDEGDGNTIVVGTEFGTWATLDGGDNWEQCIAPSPGSTGSMGCVPVHDLRQQTIYNKRYMTPQNHGSIYAGTHGRGIFRTDAYLNVGVEEEVSEVNTSELLVFPNPTADNASLKLELNAATKVEINIYSLQGQLVRTLKPGMIMRGTHRIDLGVED
ncbi:MAG: hypothetical protein JNM00_16620, partial [Flavobacteriales bacterium]|nr:hypothetical protein [Flavobacteriales bacterium]